MARLVPSVADVQIPGTHPGELETLSSLKRLGPAFTVYHGVHWTRTGANGTDFGEIDFVVVNRAGDVLVIEQKNGSLIETGNDLRKRYAEGERSAIKQLHRNIDGVRTRFRAHTRRSLKRVELLLHCPDHRVVRLNAAGIDRKRIVDASRRPELPAIIEEVLGAGEQDTFADMVHDFFRHSFEVVPDVNAHVEGQQESFMRLNGSLWEIVQNIETERLCVRGAAGCGKTGIAMGSYERAVSEGRRPLLVCFNRPLRDTLHSRLPGGGLVQTALGLFNGFLRSRGDTFDYAAAGDDKAELWQRQRDRLLEHAIPDEWRYDCLVVDEGQDLGTDDFELLQLFLREGARILWLEDADQNVRGEAPHDGRHFTAVYTERRNLRSPARIARAIHSALPDFVFRSENEAPGLGVGVTGYDEPSEQPRLVKQVVDKLRSDGRFRPEDITVVTLRGVDSSSLSECDRLGQFALRRFTGYDRHGNQRMTDGDIHFESIRRFKGREAPAVVLCDVDPALLGQDWRNLLYCGMTRATVRLEVLVNRADPLHDRLRIAAG